MRVVNAMFGRGLGGIEQAFLDYNDALLAEGHEAHALCAPDAQILQHLKKQNVHIHTLQQWGMWDPIAKWRLKQLMQRIQPDIIIAHANRGMALLKKTGFPLLGVSHNYLFQYSIHIPHMIVITRHMQHALAQAGHRGHTYLVPNMVKISPNSGFQKFKKPPVIGTLGRFVKKKGFASFIEAMALLKSAGVEFQAVLGGSGEEEHNLKQLAHRLNVQDRIHFPGWIENVPIFMNDLDIFCLPSLHESFGIVLLEAFAYGKPVVSTRSEGPLEIGTDRENILFCDIDNAAEMARLIRELLENPKFARELGESARKTVEEKYSVPHVAKILTSALNDAVKNYANTH